MNNLYIFLWALWFVVGGLNLFTDKITKLDYGIVWFLLISDLMMRALGA
jgi:hypothetical protein